MSSPLKFPTGTVLRVAVEEWLPHVRVVETNSSLQIDGPMAKMLDMLAESMHFQDTLHRPPDGSWGAPNETGHWNGMIGMVMRDEAHIALGPFIISQDRSKAVQFSTIFIIDYFRLFLSREAPKAQPLGFVKTFSEPVWYSILLTFLIVSVMFVIAKYHSTFRPRWHKITLLRNFLESIFEVFGLFFNQELIYDVRGKGFRLLLLSLFVMDMVVVKFYSSALTSVLTVKISRGKYDSLNELFLDSKFSVIMETSTAITAAMENANTGILGKMMEKKEEGVVLQYTVKDYFEAIDTKVKDEDYALFVEETTVFKLTSDYYSDSGVCEFYAGQEKLFPSMFGIIGQWNSSVIPILNPVMHRIIEGDFYNKWIRQEIPNATTCFSRDSFIVFSMDPFDFRSIGVIFALLLLGLSLASIVYCVEIGMEKFCKKKIESNNDHFNPHLPISPQINDAYISETIASYIQPKKFVSIRQKHQ